MTGTIRWLGALVLAAILATPAQAADGDVVVKVRSRKGKSIAGAHLFFVVKTWPNDRYQQRSYAGKTDAKGRFRLEGKYVVGAQYAVQIAVLADGYALESVYHFRQNGKALEPLDIRLATGRKTVLRFLDAAGKPVKGVVAFPSKRVPSAGGEHLLYPHGSDPAHLTSDEKGELRVTWFAKGDRGQIDARFPGAPWTHHEIEIKGKPIEIRGAAAAHEGTDPGAGPAGVVSEEHKVAGNDRQRYFLIGSKDTRKAGAEGFGLILVLPGGDGGDGFHPFVKRIHENAVPKGYLTVQLVSVHWNPDQAKNLVWPTAKSRVKGLRFTTEQYIEAVVGDIGKSLKLDRRRIFTLSWSSSGPACYATSLAKKTSVTGSFVAMSVFYPANLPSLSRAKGHPYYILHSPTDEVCRYPLAEKARDTLRKKGARVEFATYAGGHGWHGPIYDILRKGFVWLDGQATAKRKRR